MTPADADPGRFDDGPRLVVGSSNAAFERLVRSGDGPLVAVACGGRCEQLLRRAAALDVSADVTLFEVGTRMRSASRGAASPSPHDDPLVTGVPRAELDHVGARVDEALREAVTGGDGAGATYVDGEGLVSTVGVDGTYTVFEQLRRRHRPGGPRVWGCLPTAARDTTVAGVAPLFDVVVGIDDDGSYTQVDHLADGALDAETRLGLLEPARRRRLVRVLEDRDGRVGVDELAEAVAGDRTGSPDGLRLLFYQTDLPKLDANGVVDFDREDRTVALTPGALQLWPLLDVTDPG